MANLAVDSDPRRRSHGLDRGRDRNVGNVFSGSFELAIP